MAAQSSSLMTPSSTVTVQRSSAWQSPVPYLFGGLAIVMGLISFALLILACSYWKLSRNVHNDIESDLDRDLEAGNNKVLPVFEEKYVVIMAGQEKPTFLATPSSSRTSSFGNCSCRGSDSTKNLVEGSSTRVIEGDESNESAYQVS